MNIHFHHARPRRPGRGFQIDPEMAFAVGLFIGMMLPLWIKMLVK